MDKCVKKDFYFGSSEFHEAFYDYDIVREKIPLYCIQDPNDKIELFGERKSKFLHHSDSYIRVWVEQCHSGNKAPGGPACASTSEITKYVTGKSIQLIIIDE